MSPKHYNIVRRHIRHIRRSVWGYFFIIIGQFSISSVTFLTCRRSGCLTLSFLGHQIVASTIRLLMLMLLLLLETGELPANKWIWIPMNLVGMMKREIKLIIIWLAWNNLEEIRDNYSM